MEKNLDKVELIAPCHFGLEAMLKREVQDLGYDITLVEDGRLTFTGDVQAVCRSNIFLRTAERVLWKVGEFNAYTFDELFEKTKALPWEDYIPADGKVWVTKASSVKSKLFAPMSIQSIMKKAIADRLMSVYHVQTLPETGESYPLRVSLMKDRVTVAIDTTGESLHKRGYRQLKVAAPISETLAAALLMLTPWNKDRILMDPFCGSGTFPIEAAMMAMNMAPGMNREFQAETWKNLIPKKAWYEAVNEANDLVDYNVRTEIVGNDIDAQVLKIAKQNAAEAGVLDHIKFFKRPVSEMEYGKNEYGFIIANPPYGERLEDKEKAIEIYRDFGRQFAKMPTWSAYVITPLEELETSFKKQAAKKRKVYNGMIKTNFYSFPGPRPPRKKPEGEVNR